MKKLCIKPELTLSYPRQSISFITITSTVLPAESEITNPANSCD